MENAIENSNIIFCTNCGSRSLDCNGSVYTCNSCGSKFEKKQIDSKMFVDLRFADTTRQSTHFDQAKTLYQKIIEEYPEEDLTDVYWGLFLCEQKVIFEDNGKGEKFPSFYKINPTSVDDTPSYSKAILYATKHNPEKVQVFTALGEHIESARKMYLDISQKTKPFDVFICFKNTDANGNHTNDRQLAMDIYNEFSGKYNIFFSEKTLKDIKSNYRDYEPNIYYGLYTAKVMLLICSKREYIESQWLKNEWSRFTQINKQGGEEKCIIPIFADGFDPANLPDELWSQQGIFDDRKLIANLEHQLESIIHPVDEVAELKKMQAQAKLEQEQRLRELEQSLSKGGVGNSLQGQINSYIDAIEKFISLGNFVKAKENIAELKKLSPNEFEVYWYSLLCSFTSRNVQQLAKHLNILNSELVQNSRTFANKQAHHDLLDELEKEYNTFIKEKLDEFETKVKECKTFNELISTKDNYESYRKDDIIFYFESLIVLDKYARKLYLKQLQDSKKVFEAENEKLQNLLKSYSPNNRYIYNCLGRCHHGYKHFIGSNELFNFIYASSEKSSNCPSKEKLIDYLENKAEYEEAHKLEQEIVNLEHSMRKLAYAKTVENGNIAKKVTNKSFILRLSLTIITTLLIIASMITYMSTATIVRVGLEDFPQWLLVVTGIIVIVGYGILWKCFGFVKASLIAIIPAYLVIAIIVFSYLLITQHPLLVVMLLALVAMIVILLILTRNAPFSYDYVYATKMKISTLEKILNLIWLVIIAAILVYIVLNFRNINLSAVGKFLKDLLVIAV